MPVDPDFALVGVMDAGKNLDQRRFTGAVVADEGNDFRAVEGNVDAAERSDAATNGDLAIGICYRDS